MGRMSVWCPGIGTFVNHQFETWVCDGHSSPFGINDSAGPNFDEHIAELHFYPRITYIVNEKYGDRLKLEDSMRAVPQSELTDHSTELFAEFKRAAEAFKLF